MNNPLHPFGNEELDIPSHTDADVECAVSEALHQLKKKGRKSRLWDFINQNRSDELVIAIGDGLDAKDVAGKTEAFFEKMATEYVESWDTEEWDQYTFDRMMDE